MLAIWEEFLSLPFCENGPIFMAGVCSILWDLWVERNNRVFRDYFPLNLDRFFQFAFGASTFWRVSLVNALGEATFLSFSCRSWILWSWLCFLIIVKHPTCINVVMYLHQCGNVLKLFWDSSQKAAVTRKGKFESQSYTTNNWKLKVFSKCKVPWIISAFVLWAIIWFH